MKINFKRGFTLIELLVVIAIIGILASVVLASLNSARSKGNDAAVKANLANVRAQAELYYDNHSNGYGATLASASCPTSGGTMYAQDTTVANAVAATNSAGNGTMHCASGGADSANAQSWAISSGFKGATGATGWCVDSTGFSGTGKDALGGGASAAACQ